MKTEHLLTARITHGYINNGGEQRGEDSKETHSVMQKSCKLQK